jgi:hypothetical protein
MDLQMCSESYNYLLSSYITPQKIIQQRHASTTTKSFKLGAESYSMRTGRSMIVCPILLVHQTCNCAKVIVVLRNMYRSISPIRRPSHRTASKLGDTRKKPSKQAIGKRNQNATTHLASHHQIPPHVHCHVHSHPSSSPIRHASMLVNCDNVDLHHSSSSSLNADRHNLATRGTISPRAPR